MHGFDWGQFIASTLSVLMLLGGVGWWLAKRNHGLGSGLELEPRHICIVESMHLGLKHKMVLIQVDNQRVLATISPGEIKPLHAWVQEVTQDV